MFMSFVFSVLHVGVDLRFVQVNKNNEGWTELIECGNEIKVLCKSRS